MQVAVMERLRLWQRGAWSAKTHLSQLVKSAAAQQNQSKNQLITSHRKGKEEGKWTDTRLIRDS